MILALLLGCAPNTLAIGDFDLFWDKKSAELTITRKGKTLLELDQLASGLGSAEVEFNEGSYLFTEDPTDWTRAGRLKMDRAKEDTYLHFRVQDEAGEPMGDLDIWPSGTDILSIQLTGIGAGNRSRLGFACTGDDVFLGGGGHAMDVDHAGEAFALWVSEPGVGKVDSEDPPDDWFLQGTRHASSYPDPFLLRPEPPVGLAAQTWARVEVDLCATDPTTWTIDTWQDRSLMLVVAGDSPLEVVERRTRATGPPLVPPDWAFAPWNDAVRGADRVREVAATLREAGAPASAIWTEDWKGAAQTPYGYHLSTLWSLDEELYPDASALDAELEAAGFKWLAYFSPFVETETPEWEEISDALIVDPETGEAMTFYNPTFHKVSVLDLTDGDALDWAASKMTAALDIGFDGWMADYAEWLPVEAQLRSMDALGEHNLYPRLWQTLNLDVMANQDATFFARSGWVGTSGTSPITWAGDQRTSFDTDDGLPTVLAIGLGLSVSGVAFYGHDIAGYQSIGNDPSDKELWFRWCSLGAFSPIMRTHHGAYDQDNWAFDSDTETLAFYAQMGKEHVRLFPYLSGLATQAATTGRPLILSPAFLYEDASWGAIDAWMLGSALYVAPVLERGATARQVDLPADGRWFDWWTGAPASAGSFSAEVNEIPVFAAEGRIIPTFDTLPDTLSTATDPGIVDLEAADGERIFYVFGAGGSFTEADGTRYELVGAPGSEETVSEVLSSGTISAGGAVLQISGSTERSYTVVVRP